MLRENGGGVPFQWCRHSQIHRAVAGRVRGDSAQRFVSFKNHFRVVLDELHTPPQRRLPVTRLRRHVHIYIRIFIYIYTHLYLYANVSLFAPGC